MTAFRPEVLPHELEITAVCSIICTIMKEAPMRKPTARGVRYAI